MESKVIMNVLTPLRKVLGDKKLSGIDPVAFKEDWELTLGKYTANQLREATDHFLDTREKDYWLTKYQYKTIVDKLIYEKMPKKNAKEKESDWDWRHKNNGDKFIESFALNQREGIRDYAVRFYLTFKTQKHKEIYKDKGNQLHSLMVNGVFDFLSEMGKINEFRKMLDNK